MPDYEDSTLGVMTSPNSNYQRTALVNHFEQLADSNKSEAHSLSVAIRNEGATSLFVNLLAHTDTLMLKRLIESYRVVVIAEDLEVMLAQRRLLAMLINWTQREWLEQEKPKTPEQVAAVP